MSLLLTNPTIEQITDVNILQIHESLTIEVAKKIAQSSINELYIHNTYIDDDCVIALSKSKTINELWIDNSEMTDIGAIALSKLKTLKVLDIIMNNVTKDGINALLTSKSIEELWYMEYLKLLHKSIVLKAFYTNDNDTSTVIRLMNVTRPTYTNNNNYNKDNWHQKYMIL